MPNTNSKKVLYSWINTTQILSQKHFIISFQKLQIKTYWPEVTLRLFPFTALVKFWGPKVWNQIPIKIRENKTIHLFNKRIKPHLIQNKIIW